MKAQKPLKELPGFDDAAAHVRYHSPEYVAVLDLVGSLVVPNIRGVPAGALGAAGINSIAMGFSMILASERRRLRLLPPPRIAANDCEAP